jgi:AraC-like DNA-binding protein
VRWLSRFVEEVHILTLADGATRPVDRLPDGRSSIVLRQHAGGDGDLHVFGARSRALFKDASGFARAVMVVLKPGWSLPLLGVAADALTDRIVGVEDLWGPAGRVLTEELTAIRGVSDVLDHLSSVLASRSHDAVEPAAGPIARRAVRLFEGNGVDRVDRVAKQLGVTARHLRRAFVESIGVGPKEFARGVRLRRAIHQTTSSDDWGRIAADAGYYDQAHLIADFRDLLGITPGAYLERARAAAHAA